MTRSRPGIAAYETVGRRAAVSDTGFVTLIDDCYNANPDSMKSGIDSLLRLNGRHVCILGDMLELGEHEREMHYETGRYAAENGVELVLCSGRLAEDIAKGAGARGVHFDTREELISALPHISGAATQCSSRRPTACASERFQRK